MIFELIVPEPFFESDFVPRQSAFSGRGEPLTVYTVHYWRALAKARHGQVSPLTLIRVRVPCAAGEVAGWQWRRVGMGIVALICLLGGLLLICTGVGGNHGGWLVAALGGGLLWLAWTCWQRSHDGEVQFEPFKDGRSLRIVWPERCEEVYEVYAAALEAWREQGMPSAHTAEDDSFGEHIAPGWDEASAAARETDAP